MRIPELGQKLLQQQSNFDALVKQDSGKAKSPAGVPRSEKTSSKDQSSGEIFGGSPRNPGDMGATTLALGEEDGGGTPIPVEPDGGIGDGAGPIPGVPDDPIFTTLAIGEEDDGGGAPAPLPPIGGEKITGTRGDDTLTGTDGDDRIRSRAGNDTISTGQGADEVSAGRGDDVISVTGIGDKKIDGGRGHDALELKGQRSDYNVDTRSSRTTVYTAPDGSRITARNIESVRFLGAVAPEPPAPNDFVVFYELTPNDLGATSLDVNGNIATLRGPNTEFTFTGVDPSGIAADGPIIATGGSGTINGEETTAVALSPFGDAVLTIGSGFNPTGTQDVSAAFANGATLSATVGATALP